jgi:predicted amino acid-binding ACT domain protein
MALSIRAVEYFYVTVKDRPGEACAVLSELSRQQVNLLAFNAIPTGLHQTQLVIFPEDTDRLVRAAENIALTLSGSQRALLIQGDDQLGSLVGIHQKLCDASINVYASNGVADGRGGFGYIVHVRSEDFDRAAQILGA